MASLPLYFSSNASQKTSPSDSASPNLIKALGADAIPKLHETERVTMIVRSLSDMNIPHCWMKQARIISYWSPRCEMTTDDNKILKHTETWIVPVHCPVCVDCDECRPLRSDRFSWLTYPSVSPKSKFRITRIQIAERIATTLSKITTHIGRNAGCYLLCEL